MKRASGLKGDEPGRTTAFRNGTGMLPARSIWDGVRRKGQDMKRIVCTIGVVWLCCGAAFAQPYALSYDSDGAIVVNGERTLIVGSYYAAKSDRPYAEMAEAGFNLVRASGPEQMDQAQAAGVMAWTSVGALDLEKREESEAKLRERVNTIKGHPALAIIETIDEPAWDWLKKTPRVKPEVFKQTYPILKELAPDKLLYMNHAPANLVSTMKPYNAGTDIVACDIYPVNPGGLTTMYALFPDGRQGDLNNSHISQVGEYVDKMRRVAGPDRPLFMVLQAFAWEKLVQETDVVEQREEKIFYPSYNQSRFMAFQALIKGANGIMYWGSDYTPQPSQAWDDLKRVTREVADLGEVIVAPDPGVAVETTYHEMGHSVDDGIQILVRDHGGFRYVFTCNADKNKHKATLAGLGEWTKCTVLNEDRELALAGNVITDEWPRFSVHIYRLEK